MPQLLPAVVARRPAGAPRSSPGPRPAAWRPWPRAAAKSAWSWPAPPTWPAPMWTSRSASARCWRRWRNRWSCSVCSARWRQDPRGVTVSIGRENPYDGLAEASVVATAYGPDATAKVGVLGPPGWTIPPLWPPSARWPATFRGSWGPDGPGTRRDFLPTGSTKGRDTHFEHPLRRSWSLPRRIGGGDQEGLPETGPHPAPGREPGGGRRGPLQGRHPRLRGPLRSAEAPGL